MIDDRTGFSLWADFIEREFIGTKLKEMLALGVVDGATSNPSIFANAITKSSAYKEQLKELDGKSAKEKYEALAIRDIKAAAKELKRCYDTGYAGYVSIEVDPYLSNDAKGTVEEGVRLFNEISKPNIMIKVPATEAGFEAMEQLMAKGINVNATLIFSPEQALKAQKAMKNGIDAFVQYSDDGRIEGVISIFVSRFDRKLDARLKELDLPTAKTGIYNAAKIYNELQKCNEPAIKPLFASTGTKPEQNLPAEYYISELCAKNSINTAPIDTIEAYEKSDGRGKMALPVDETIINTHFKVLEVAGINIDSVYQELMNEGLKAFEDAFSNMLNTIE